MDGGSTLTTSTTATTLFDFSTKISTQMTSQDIAGCVELKQPQIRVLRHYGRHRRSSSSPSPAVKRRAVADAAAAMQNGTGRPSPSTCGTAGGRGFVDVDCLTSLSRAGATTTTKDAAATAAATTAASKTYVATVKTTTFTTDSTTTPETLASDKSSSFLVVTQNSNNVSTSCSTFGSSLDVRLPLDGLRQPSATDSKHRTEVKTGKFDKSSNSNLALNVDAEVTRVRRWRMRRRAMIATPSNDVKQVTHEASRKDLRVRRCIGCLKSFVAFLFSTIGLTKLLIGYIIVGGIIFKSIEAPNEVGRCLFISSRLLVLASEVTTDPTILRCYSNMIMDPPLRLAALSDDARLTSVCLSVCLTSVCRVHGPKSRTERFRKTKIGTEVAHVTLDSDTTVKIKRSKVNLHGAGHIVVASRTAC